MLKWTLPALVAVCLCAGSASAYRNDGKMPADPQNTMQSSWDDLITPTFEWILLYCDSPTLDGEPLNPGDTIFAYDADGILCGVDTVRFDGLYGFMPVYIDDPFSPEDEGAMPGDTLSFAINSMPVLTETPVVWIANGDRIELCSFLSVPVDEFELFVDIKPGSCPNPFNLTGNLDRGKSVLPVAVLGTEDFDVRDIDPETITLAGAYAVRWNYEDVAQPVEDRDDSCECHERPGDGYEDLTLKFYRKEIAPALENAMDRDYVALRLEAELYDGTPITGYDCVWVIKNENGRGNGNGNGRNPSGKPGLAGTFELGNYPNPFNPATNISFNLPTADHATLNVYNVRGALVTTLFNGSLEAGNHVVTWDGSTVASGVYFYRLTTSEGSQTRKMLLLK